MKGRNKREDRKGGRLEIGKGETEEMTPERKRKGKEDDRTQQSRIYACFHVHENMHIYMYMRRNPSTHR